MDNKIVFLDIVIFFTFFTLFVSNVLFSSGFDTFIMLSLLLMYILSYVFFYRCGNFQKLLFILSVCFFLFSISSEIYFNSYSPFLMVLNWFMIWVIFRWGGRYNGEIDSKYLLVSVIFIFYLIFNLILLFSPGTLGTLEINLSILILALSIIFSIMFMITMIVTKYSLLSYNNRVGFENCNIIRKLKSFFTPLAIITLMSGLFYFFNGDKGLSIYESYYYFALIYFLSISVLFLVYIVFPLIKILFKKYVAIFQRIVVLLLLIFLFPMYFSVDIMSMLVLSLYLAIFLNFSLDIEKNSSGYYILTSSIGKNRYCFDELISGSSFNVLMSVVFLTIIIGLNLYYFTWSLIFLPVVLTIILSIVLVMSSIFYRKTEGSIDY